MIRLSRNATASMVKAMAGLYWRREVHSSTTQAERVSKAAEREADTARVTWKKQKKTIQNRNEIGPF